jgi:GTP pyrophosphokinase
VAWLRQLLEWQQSLSGAEEFVESVKQDIFHDQVFVYTPKGDVKDLPAGATPIDFAYRIHTELGHFCVGARVNGRLVPLTYQLQNGDVVDILTSKSSKGPSRDWLNPHLGYLNTSASREKVRGWFKRQQRAENLERGSVILEKELRRLGLSVGAYQAELLRAFKVDQLDDLLAMIGYGEVSAAQVGARLAALQHPVEEPAIADLATGVSKANTYSPGIRVLGTGDLLTQMARCCQPVPGDAILGYITRSRGVTVHRRDCHNIVHEDERERLVEVEWGQRGQLYQAAILIEAWDRVGLLRDITSIVTEERVNMVGVRAVEQGDHTVQISMTLDTSGLEQLSRLLNRLEAVRGVIGVSRARDAAGVEAS